MQRIPHVPMVSLRWFLWFPCPWIFNLSLFISRSCAGRNIGINRTTFQQLQLYLLKLWRAFIAQVGCPVVIKQMVMKFNWIFENTKVFWLGLSTYFRFFNGRHPSMLLDVNTATGSCDCGNYVRCAFYSSVYCLFLYAPLVNFSRRSHIMMTLEGATSKEPSIQVHADTRIVVQALDFKCIICDGEFASKHAAECHCRQPAFIGTKCADPRSIRSLSLTERPNVSVGILRHHSTAPLGQSMYILYQPFTSYISRVKHKLGHIL